MTSTPVAEMNFDGLVGPTHNYAGLAHGNVASQSNAGLVSSPRGAVLEGLAKMATLHALGVPQGILPPHARPHFGLLRALGFGSDETRAIERAAREAPEVLRAAYSASMMWTANAATVSPSADTADGRVHFTPANLQASLHRSLEPAFTAHTLRRLFEGERFVHHAPLPGVGALGDEGAANHIRLHDPAAPGPGLEVFVYGRGRGPRAPQRFPARQTELASEAVARRHGVRHALLLQQHPDAIDAGVFHNDVISVGHERVLLRHEDAFLDADGVPRIREAAAALGVELVDWCVPRSALTVDEAVATYLFNSQIVTTDAGWVLIAPRECEEHPRARAAIEALRAQGLADVVFPDVRQSMRNGGGPACLRLRVALTQRERAGVRPGCVFDDDKHVALRAWAEAHYRETLAPDDLRDPKLPDEVRAALDALTGVLGLGDDFYEFQRAPQS